MAKCRSCGAEIIWIKMASGRMMPCDAAPISYDRAPIQDKEKLVLVTPDGRITRGVFNPGSGNIGYTSHFATCPNADAHRNTECRKMQETSGGGQTDDRI